jgi:hypothetical protein
MQDITPQDTQDTQDTPPVVTTFIILRDGDWNDGDITAPVFQAYVDVPSPMYPDIDAESYSATRKVLDRFLDVNQPDGVAGTWWVGRVPAEEDRYYPGLHLDRYRVQYILDITH